MSSYDFFEINFGHDASERDSNLKEYFVKPKMWDKIVSNDLRYIIGRKGTGKSAIIRMLEETYKDEILIKPSLRDFAPVAFRSFVEDRLNIYQ